MTLYKAEDGQPDRSGSAVRLISIDRANALHDERCPYLKLEQRVKAEAGWQEEIERLRAVVEQGRQLREADEAEIKRLRDGYLADENGNEYVAVCVLKEKIRELTAEEKSACDRGNRLAAQCQDLQADNARLREALRLVPHVNRTRGYPTGAEWTELVRVAEAALEGK